MIGRVTQTRLAALLCAAALLFAVAPTSSATTRADPVATYRLLAKPGAWRRPPRPFRYLSVGTFGRLVRVGVGTILVEYAYTAASTNVSTGLSALVVEVIKSPRLAQSWLTTVKVKNRATALPRTRIYRWVTTVTGGYEPNMAMRVGSVVVTATGGKTKQRPTRVTWGIVDKLLAFAAGRVRFAQR